MTEITQILDCLKRIDRRLANIEALIAKPESSHTVQWADPRDFTADTLARLEADDEPPETDNAQIQGAELAKP